MKYVFLIFTLLLYLIIAENVAGKVNNNKIKNIRKYQHRTTKIRPKLYYFSIGLIHVSFFIIRPTTKAHVYCIWEPRR